MQLFYLKNINSDFLEGSEYNHCTNALRNKKGDVIYLTDGEGNLYNAKIFDIRKRMLQFEFETWNRTEYY